MRFRLQARPAAPSGVDSTLTLIMLCEVPRTKTDERKHAASISNWPHFHITPALHFYIYHHNQGCYPHHQHHPQEHFPNIQRHLTEPV